MRGMIIVFLLALVAQRINSQKACESFKFIVNQAYTLTQKNATLTFEFTEPTKCAFTVKGFKKMDFKLSVSKYTLNEDQCKADFVKAYYTKPSGNAQEDFKVCAANKLEPPITSKQQSLYVSIETTVNKAATVVLNLESVQGEECGKSFIQLTSNDEKITFPPQSHPFTEQSDCDIMVRGIEGREFKLTFPEMNFNCEHGFVAAASKQSDLATPTKICGTKSITNPIASANGLLYLKIETTNNAPKFTANFETVYSECGESEITLNADSLNISLPVANKKFTSTTNCKIKVTGKNSANFGLTIPTINFPSDCTKNYVAASTTENELSSTQYKKCGTKEVTDKFNSANGTMFLQILTPQAEDKTAVTLHFQSSNAKRGQYTFMAFLSFLLVSVEL